MIGIDYSPEHVQVKDVTDDVTGFLGGRRPPWTVVRWINVDGIHNLNIIRAFAEKYDLHPLAVADMIHTPQRPKIEEFPANEEHHARLFMVARMIRLLNGHLSCGWI